MSDSELSASSQPAGSELLRRSGKNINGYFGQTINLTDVLTECDAAAKAHGWTAGEIPVNEELSLPIFTRAGSVVAGSTEATASAVRVYISAGIHGDEPAGPLAICQLLKDDQWPDGCSFWVCGCLNPAGCSLNRRENAQGFDLNRQYLNPEAAETIAHINWLKNQPAFDLCLCLHEDWEAHGFYVYELNPDNLPSLAAVMIDRVASVCPIDTSELIEGRAAKYGIIRPSIDPRDRPQWPESFYLLTYKTRLSYTLEAPSDFPLSSRVAALVTGVRAALEIKPPRAFAG